MDKGSLVNIDWKPIADVANNLIDKLANGIGWIATPKGQKAQQIEAQLYLIEQIKNDENMPPLAKAASISKAKKLIKEYTNQNDIFNEAMNYLSSKGDFDKVKEVNDDWLDFFFDKARSIEREDMQIIWSKLLAKEVKNPNSVSKQLLHILTIIDHSDALSFSKLVNFSIYVDNKDCVIIFYDELYDIYTPNGLVEEELLGLEAIGLLHTSMSGYDYSIETDGKIKYQDREIDIKGKEKIHIGNVVRSKAGEELMSILTDRELINGFEDMLKRKL